LKQFEKDNVQHRCGSPVPRAIGLVYRGIFYKKVWCDEATENGCRRPGLTFTSWRCAGAARDGEVPVYLRLSRNRVPNVPVLHPWQERLSDKSDFNDFTPSEQALAGRLPILRACQTFFHFYLRLSVFSIGAYTLPVCRRRRYVFPVNFPGIGCIGRPSLPARCCTGSLPLQARPL